MIILHNLATKHIDYVGVHGACAWVSHGIRQLSNLVPLVIFNVILLTRARQTVFDQFILILIWHEHILNDTIIYALIKVFTSNASKDIDKVFV